MKAVLLAIGLAQGVAVGAAAMLVFSTLGVASQLSAITGTRGSIRLYGGAICLGMVALTTPYTAGLRGVKALLPLLLPIGLCAGIYTGMLLSSLAEIIDIFPAVSGKLRLKGCVRLLVWALALGKTVGVLFYYLSPAITAYGL